MREHPRISRRRPGTATLLVLFGVVVSLPAVLLAADEPATRPAQDRSPVDATGKRPDERASTQPGQDWAIYVGCGNVNGPGKVYQFDPNGRLLGTASLTNTPYDLKMHKDGLVAVLPGGKSVVLIGPAGTAKVLASGPRLPGAVALGVNPVTGDILVGDNAKDVVLMLPARDLTKLTELVELPSSARNAQSMSLAVTRDGYVILMDGGTEPGVYRFPQRAMPSWASRC